MTREALLAAVASGDRLEITAALQAVDPNGSHSDAAAVADGLEPYTLSEAIAAALEILSRD